MAKRIKNKSSKRYSRIKTAPGQSSINEELLILDRFTSKDIDAWQTASDGIDEYHHKLFSALEAQRRRIYTELCEAVSSSSNHAMGFEGWIRIVDYQYSTEPLNARGYKYNYGGRFNYGQILNPHHFSPFPALYVASKLETAMKERFSISDTHSSGLRPEDFQLISSNSFSSIAVRGNLQNIFDLSNSKNLTSFVKLTKDFSIPTEVTKLARKLQFTPPAIISTPAELFKNLMDLNWRGFPAQIGLPSNSQLFGKILRDAGFEGVLFESTRGSGNCVAIFLENLNDGSFIELMDPPPESVTHRRLDKSNFQSLI